MLINLTTEPVKINLDGGALTFPPSGKVARVERTKTLVERVGACEACAHYGGFCGSMGCAGEGIPVYRTLTLRGVGIPPYSEGSNVKYVVSEEVGVEYPRPDCYTVKDGRLMKTYYRQY